MYLKKAVIEKIKSIEHFEMDFRKPAGWHVIIGDNGSGKSTIIRSIALALVGPEEAQGLRADWRDWLNRQSDSGSISLEINGHAIDKSKKQGRKPDTLIVKNQLEFKRNGIVVMKARSLPKGSEDPKKYNWGQVPGWFSASYGPFRRFEGGNREWEKVFYTQPRLGAHLSAFGEDVALTEALGWLINLHFKSLESIQAGTYDESGVIIQNLKKLINSQDFLPHKAEIESISSEGVYFKDGNGSIISVNQLSDGYRSILSLTFELIRQLVRVYNANDVFRNIKKDNLIIDLPGIVLIDEVDAHLHPTWQTRIGQWFTKYFPKMQFIVTTHSPLVCRASDKGSIWRLAAPGSDYKSGEVTGTDKNRLIYGNILDAYGTEVFGSEVSINKDSVEKIEELVRLSKKRITGQMSGKEDVKLQELRNTFPTNDTIEL